MTCLCNKNISRAGLPVTFLIDLNLIRGIIKAGPSLSPALKGKL